MFFLKLTVFTACIFLVTHAHAQTAELTCTDLKDGTFYSYPKNSSDRYYSIREGSIQTEVNLLNNDTTVWQVKWLDDCRYSLTYLSGAKTATKEVINLLKKHKLVYEITRVSSDYYLFTGHFDKVSNAAFQADTMWLYEKVNPTSNALYEYVPDVYMPQKAHFNDTSQYALVYIYRPRKLSNSLGNYLIYCNDNVMCVAKNNRGYLFKVVKEGKLHLSSRLFKDESSIDLDIRFGKKYYVKSMIHWGISKRLYNFKLEMAAMNEQQGEIEFSDVKFQ